MISSTLLSRRAIFSANILFLTDILDITTVIHRRSKRTNRPPKRKIQFDGMITPVNIDRVLSASGKREIKKQKREVRIQRRAYLNSRSFLFTR